MAQKNSKTRSSSGRKTIQSRKKRKPQNNGLVLRLLLLVALVLVIFEGRLIYTMFTQGKSGQPDTVATAKEEKPAKTTTVTADPNLEIIHASGSDENGDVLVGVGEGTLPSSQEGDASQTPATQAPVSDTPQTSESPSADSPEYADVVVPKQSVPVDDSFFHNSVFIGDSRMEGFRNASGITQGTFYTSIGMSLDSFNSAKVSTPNGTITVFQGLSGVQYDKIYLMLGTNDLGYFPWEMFLGATEDILKKMHELQPSATIYICSVIFVEEAKVTTSYVNNANVMIVNGYLLQACKDLDYCYYLNLNEIFNNGYNSLIEGASNDGVHLENTYLEQMLVYIKNHYLGGAPAQSQPSQTSAPEEAQSEAPSGEEENGEGDKLV